MGILNWRRRRGPDGQADNRREVAELAERITRLSPRLRLLPRYARRLAPSIRIALDHVRAVVAGIPAPREASPETWGTDPYIHACFGTGQDVALAFSRAADLRDYFDASPGTDEAFAVLGMEMVERRTLGVALEGDVMRSDVLQTTVSFNDHQIRICGDSHAGLYREIEARMLDQLALQGLASAAAGGIGRDERLQEMALLSERLRLLERQGVGMRSMLGGDVSPDPEERERLRAQIAQIDAANGDTALPAGQVDALERQMEGLQAALTNAGAYLLIERRRMRLSRMNVLQPDDSTAPGDDLEFLTASIPGDPRLVRTFLLVRFARATMLSRMTLLEEAERLL
ncbi:hypothetical protein SAMN05216321_105143 [Cupriavidus sp. OV038]|uniref:hypothetical protein n=1 Tax=unclassified Cupriavidus TaxID=2640874 RepID=UPI0008DFEA89|nr:MULTISPECIES: hypothetical protein [unclassified Cupriavidus]SFC56020.1 hypothetical protein SAMN05216321_105143 [Cupriavidus sp. OV038]SFP46389.1 hypothetical protein SAMN05216322_106246 [Cupriavidus sp. OV096]